MNYIFYRFIGSFLLSVLILSYSFSQESQKSDFTFKENDQGVQLLENGKPVFFYQQQTKILAGQYKCSNYLHPLYSLSGDTLTEESPTDHPYHRGIFWAWHQHYIDNKSVGEGWLLESVYQDIVNIRKRLLNGTAQIDLTVLWRSSLYQNGQPYIEEETRIIVYPKETNVRKIDFEISLKALVPGVQIGGSDDEKGYGGFCTRVKLPDGLIFTSTDGPVKPQNTQIKAGPWMDLSGGYGKNGEISGLTILCHTSTPDYPAPWILRQKASMQNVVFPGRERINVPTGKPIVLRYRLIIHNANAASADIPKLQAEYEKMFEAGGQLPDQKMVEKYGLVIPPPDEKLDPAPEWLQRADMFISGTNLWQEHKFILKDTLMTRIVRMRDGNRPGQITENYPVETVGSFDGSLVKGVSLISHVPHSKKAFEEAHKQGIKVIPYVHFTDIHSIYADQDVYLFQHPEVLLKDSIGKWVHISMDGSDRIFRFLTCINSPGYWKLNLAYIKKMMDWGADGVFIDNVENREPCFAPKFNVGASSSARNPEFPPYTHEHLFPDATQDYAWDRFLQTVRVLVKSYGVDKIVLLNSGIDTPFQKDGDCCMWESFIYSWIWQGRGHTWEDVKKVAKDNEWYLSAGRRITALSTINRSSKVARDDAFWAFSAARLVDFVWWASLKGTGAENLYQAQMGKGLMPLKEINSLAYRAFENGIIVLNDSDDDQNIELILPVAFQPKHLLDVYDGSKIIQVKHNKIKVSVSGKTARVYLLPQIL